jgi:hypothetical protein
VAHSGIKWLHYGSDLPGHDIPNPPRKFRQIWWDGLGLILSPGFHVNHSGKGIHSDSNVSSASGCRINNPTFLQTTKTVINQNLPLVASLKQPSRHFTAASTIEPPLLFQI